MIPALAALVLTCAVQQPNRLWLGELELVGPLEAVVLDCGPAGRTVVRGPLLAGERRRVTVPLPLAPALGLAGLAAQPPPTLETEPPAAEARWLGTLQAQPEAGWTRLAPDLRSRPRPPVPGQVQRLPPAALLVAWAGMIVGAVLVRGRARAGRARLGRAVLALLAAGVALALVRTSAPSGEETATVRLLEGRLPEERGLAVTARARSIDLDPGDAGLRLEAQPSQLALVFEVDLAEGTWRAEGEGVLVHFRDARLTLAGPEARFDEPLEPAWYRGADGAWQGFEGVAGGLGLPGTGPDPPGWLRAGLPPGRSALLGWSDRGPGRWVRLTGAPPPVALERD